MLNWCTSVVCAWNISKHPRSDLRYRIWWVLCFRIGITAVAKAEGTNAKIVWLDEIGAIQFFSVVSCYILLFLLKNILTAWCDFSSNRTSRDELLRLEATDTRLGHQMWYDVINGSFPWSLWFLVLSSLFFSKPPHRDERSLNNIKETPQRIDLLPQVNAMHAETSRCLAENSKS